MSSTMPYLRSLRKSELTTLAEISDLKGYEDLKKADLESALDAHLRENKAIFSGDKRLADYYRRLSQPARVSSPVKKEPKRDGSPEETKRPVRRSRTNEPEGEDEGQDKSQTQTQTQSQTPSSTNAAVTQTPARSPLSIASSLPPSPAVIASAVDRQTAQVRRNLSRAWNKSGVSERSDVLRETLSSIKAIELIIISVEVLGLAYELVPLRYVATVPAVSALRTPEFAIRVPDLFVLVTGAFWAPVILWALTSLAIPLTVAYFINLSHRAQVSHSYGTRRSTAAIAAAPTFDPLVYNIAKSLVAYLVYAKHFTFWDVFNHFTVDKVNTAIPGQWPGLVTLAVIGVVASLYDAVLKK